VSRMGVYLGDYGPGGRVSRAMAVLLAAAGAVFALVVPLDHGTPFAVGLITAGVVAGGGVYAASAPNKNTLLKPDIHSIRLL
jgi:hypothetical protein